MGNTNYYDIQSMYVGNIQNIKCLVERAFKYDLKNVINIPKLKNALAANMKDKWYFNDFTSMVKHWTKV